MACPVVKATVAGSARVGDSTTGTSSGISLSSTNAPLRLEATNALYAWSDQLIAAASGDNWLPRTIQKSVPIAAAVTIRTSSFTCKGPPRLREASFPGSPAHGPTISAGKVSRARVAWSASRARASVDVMNEPNDLIASTRGRSNELRPMIEPKPQPALSAHFLDKFSSVTFGPAEKITMRLPSKQLWTT